MRIRYAYVGFGRKSREIEPALLCRSAKAGILHVGVRQWADRSPIRSGPEGSSRNEFWSGSPPTPLITTWAFVFIHNNGISY